jgi:competence ComEA-like helix-hairpin-helix protein
MKQNLSEANRLLVLLLTFTLLTCGCAQRQRKPLLQTSITESRANDRKININSASAEELGALPGIGRVIADRIIQHRSQHGSFRRVEHIMLVRGISERKFLNIAPFITVN